MSASQIPTLHAPPCDDTTERIERFQTLEPGTYWRALRDVKVELPHWQGHYNTIPKDRVHLLSAIDVFDQAAHTAVLAGHPTEGSGEYRLLLAQFLQDFEYAPDGEAVREAEMRAIHARVGELQAELLQGQHNPALMALDVDKGLATWEAEQRRKAEREGQPLSGALVPADIPGGRLRTDIGFVLENKLTAGDVQAMRLVAEREATRAELQAKWITERTDAIASTIKSLTPFFKEKAAVALARTSGIRQYASELMKGIASLDLYTGKGVEVETLVTGASAAPDQKLHVLQGKVFAEEELAAWADVDAEFDYRDMKNFDRALQEESGFRAQILPFPRMIVSIATRRAALDYGDGVSGIEAALRNARNKLTFLLVRDGDNIYRVYSGEPTHEATPRLFPTMAEIDGLFRGFDGENITFRDLEFTKRAKRMDALALHYKRFLILLCGLDHRDNLFGRFYDPAEALQFLSLSFQQRHFVFVADDEPGTLLGEGRPAVANFMAAQNAQLRSGSRVLCYHNDLITPRTAPSCEKLDSDGRCVNTYARPLRESEELICYKDGPELCVEVEARRERSDGRFNARVSLTQALKERAPGFLCLDGVTADGLDWYVSNRRARIHHLDYLRLFKRAVAALRKEEAAEAPASAYLRESALQAGLLTAGEENAALDRSIVAWRCANRGKALPPVTDKAALNPILTQLYAQQNSDTTLHRVLAWIESRQLTALRVTLTGKNRLAVYAEVPAAERDATMTEWGWLRRYSLTTTSRGLTCTAERFEWLTTAPNAAETILQEWPAIADWLHVENEPFKPKTLTEARDAVNAGLGQYQALFKTEGAGLDPTHFARLLRQLIAMVLDGARKQAGESNLRIPFGAYVYRRRSEPPEVRVLAMQAPLVNWLYHYADETQRRTLVQQFSNCFKNKAHAIGLAKQPLQLRITRIQTPREPIDLSADYAYSDTLIDENAKTTSTKIFDTGTYFPFSEVVANLRAGGTVSYLKRGTGPARVYFADQLAGLSPTDLDAFFPYLHTSDQAATAADAQ